MTNATYQEIAISENTVETLLTFMKVANIEKRANVDLTNPPKVFVGGSVAGYYKENNAITLPKGMEKTGLLVHELTHWLQASPLLLNTAPTEKMSTKNLLKYLMTKSETEARICEIMANSLTTTQINKLKNAPKVVQLMVRYAFKFDECVMCAKLLRLHLKGVNVVTG